MCLKTSRRSRHSEEDELALSALSPKLEPPPDVWDIEEIPQLIVMRRLPFNDEERE